MAKVPVKKVSWEEIVEWSRVLADKVRESGYRPTVVIAVARGGYVPARLVCDFLGVENLVSIQSQHWTEAAKKAERAVLKFRYKIDLSGHKALLVDDIVDTGESLLLAKKHVLEEWKPEELRIAVLQWISPIAKFRPDYYALEVKDWVWFQYPWTRLEDVTQFIKRMLTEEPPEKDALTYGEIKEKFKEWYGIEVEDYYYRYALSFLEEQGLVKRLDGDKYQLLKR